jgi:hypothetical protein
MRSLAYTAVILSALVALSACSNNDTPGTASPAPSAGDSSPGLSSSPSTTQQLPYAGAPKVSNPLPAAVLDGDPCVDALTSEQVTQALGAPAQGEYKNIPTGPYCAWANTSTQAQVIVAYVNTTKLGLSGVYANTKPKTKTWQELPAVSGFPAVAHDFTSTDCQVSVGLADDLSIDVTGFLSFAKRETGADPCQAAAKAAGVVVDNLKKKAG